MKILMLLENDFPPDVRVEKEALSLRSAGHEIAISSISNRKNPINSVYKEIHLFKKYISFFLKKSGAVALRFPFYFRYWKRFVNEVYKEFEFDLIHVHDLPLSSVGYWAKQKYKSGLVIDLHENYPALVEASPYSQTITGKILISIRQWRRYEYKMLKHADRIITVVEEMAKRIISLGIQEEKIYVVQNLPALDEKESVSKGKDEKKLVLFYSGGITLHRGLQDVIRALPLLYKKNPDLVLWVVGSGSYEQALKQMAEKLGVIHLVKFFGWLPFDKMTELQSMSDIALIPHLRSEQSDNSSPNKLFEYMLNGKAVLASDCLSVKRIIDETNSGKTYRSGDIESLSEQFEVLTDLQTRKKLAENGYRAVVERYNWQLSERSLLSLYQSMEDTLNF